VEPTDPGCESLSAENLLGAVEKKLREGGIDGALTEARWIVEDVLDADYSKIKAGMVPCPAHTLIEKAFGYVEERLSGTPLAYVIGYTEFYGIHIKLEPGVLIPRPETEILVETAIRLLDENQWSEPKILDLYTGSGCIILAIKAARQNVSGLCYDSDDKAILCATLNRDKAGVDNVIFIHNDVEGIASSGRQFHLVTANPPYIRSGDIALLQPEIVKHENHLALDGGLDGLKHLRFLAQNAQQAILPGGYLICEIGYDQKKNCEQLFADWSSIAFVGDLEHHPRVLVAQP
jgi:release factor glutamine methyltransferase